MTGFVSETTKIRQAQTTSSSTLTAGMDYSVQQHETVTGKRVVLQ
jgi:hypothetical protein